MIGAAILLFVASFLDFYGADCTGDYCDKIEMPNAWDLKFMMLALPAIFLLGVVAAVLIVVGRFLPEGRRLVGLTLPQWGTVLTVAAAWNALWALFLGPDKTTIGLGAILSLFATLVMAAAALLTEQVPALKASLLPAPKPQQPGHPGMYGQPPQGGYGYPGQQPGPYGAQPPQGYGYPGQPGPGQPQPHVQAQQPGQPQPQPQQAQPAPAQVQPQPTPAAGTPSAPSAPEQAFQPFWFAVPVNRPLYPEDGGSGPVAELAPGTWYLAVAQQGQQLVAQTQDGRRGVLQDTTGIQRG